MISTDLRHIGWWSEDDGFTASYRKDSRATAYYMVSRRRQPVYIKRSERGVNLDGASERHYKNRRRS